jgi:CheY-like chemotaxis protein
VKCILVCDDEPHILEGLRHLLQGNDREIVLVSGAKAALQVIQKQGFDLLITDVMMPEMSGLELVAALRSREATKSLPIIILTAKGQAHDADMARNVWDATVVGKPFKPQQLREAVSAALANGPVQPQTAGGR